MKKLPLGYRNLYIITQLGMIGTVCSPTRAVLLAGKYQQRVNIDGVVTTKHCHDKRLDSMNTSDIFRAMWTIIHTSIQKIMKIGGKNDWKLMLPRKNANPLFFNLKDDLEENSDLHKNTQKEWKGHSRSWNCGIMK